MTLEWHALCVGIGIAVTKDGVNVDLGNGRAHRVLVETTSDTWELTAVVATRRILASIEAPSIQCWTRNRLSDLVGFRVDGRGRLAAIAWVPRAGVTSEEFTMQVRLMAREADRFEFSLSGADAH
jgi:hypothetical protein